MSRRVGRSGPRTLRSGRHITISLLLVSNGRHPGCLIEANPYDVVDAIAQRFDVGDEDDLREAVGQASEQVRDGATVSLIEGAEDLVEDEQGQRLPSPLRDH